MHQFSPECINFPLRPMAALCRSTRVFLVN